jgi:hypothetical protein
LEYRGTVSKIVLVLVLLLVLEIVTNYEYEYDDEDEEKADKICSVFAPNAACSYRKWKLWNTDFVQGAALKFWLSPKN